MYRSVKKYSQAAVNRKRKFAQGPAPKELQLYDFLHRKKDKPRPQLPVNLKVGKAVSTCISCCVLLWCFIYGTVFGCAPLALVLFSSFRKFFLPGQSFFGHFDNYRCKKFHNMRTQGNQ